jgi:DNA invertase Pin-like site-specific DNA recombinase
VAHGKFVAYYRVSTARQGQSGLGLEAQREAVERYLNGGDWELLETFTEIETGKGADALDKRPQLRAALAYAKKHKATLIIAKLDRLARNVHFVSGLLEQRSAVTIIAADMPDADVTMLQIYAVMAEREARVIGERTKAALAAAKARGQVLGANGKVLAAKHKAEASARVAPLAGVLMAYRAQGLALRAIADRLNGESVSSPGGGHWHATNVQRALRRVEG